MSQDSKQKTGKDRSANSTGLTQRKQVELWKAINEYTMACGGNPEKIIFGNTRRVEAVTQINRLIG